MSINNINIEITNKIATVSKSALIICGNSDYTITFIFDDEWSKYDLKTARFTFGENEYIDVPFTGNVCNVPILKNIYRVKVGVYAGDLRTTTPATIPCRKSILCGSGTHVDPEKDVYNEIIKLINDGAVKGPKGDPFTYEDFTPEQLAALRGPKGDPGIETLAGTAENPVNVLDSSLYTSESKIYFITGVMNNCPELMAEYSEAGMLYGFLKIFAVDMDGETMHVSILDLSPMKTGGLEDIPLYFTIYEDYVESPEDFEWAAISDNASYASEDEDNPVDLNNCEDDKIATVHGYLKNAPVDSAYKAVVINSDYYQYFFTEKIYFRRRRDTTWTAIETFENADVLKTLNEDTDSNLLHRGNKLMKELDVESLINEKAKIKSRKTYTSYTVSMGLKDGDEIYLSNAQGQSSFYFGTSWGDFSEAWIRIKTRDWPESASYTTTPKFPDIFVYAGGVTPEVGRNQIWDFEIKGNVVKATQVV